MVNASFMLELSVGGGHRVNSHALGYLVMIRLVFPALAMVASIASSASAQSPVLASQGLSHGNQVIFCNSHEGAQFVQRLHSYMAENVDRKTGDFSGEALRVYNKFRSKLPGCADLPFATAVRLVKQKTASFVRQTKNLETIDGEMVMLEVDGKNRFVADYDAVLPYGFSKIIAVKTSLVVADYPPLGGRVYFPWPVRVQEPRLIWKRY